MLWFQPEQETQNCPDFTQTFSAVNKNQLENEFVKIVNITISGQ